MKKNQVTENWMPARYIREDETILDFTGLYEVSDLGRVKSLNYMHTGKARVLKCPKIKNKHEKAIYYLAALYKDGKRYPLFVHRLILSSFDPKGFKPGCIVNHKVERTATSCINTLSNLEWISQKDNVNTEHCKNLKSKTQTNHPAKSKRIQVTDLATGEIIVYPSAREVWRALGINHSVPYNCIKQRNGYYKKLNLHFAYV